MQTLPDKKDDNFQTDYLALIYLVLDHQDELCFVI